MDLEGKKILDVTCGGRSIWFDKQNPLCLYCDNREVEYEKTFGKKYYATRHIKVKPDMLADFTDLPFNDNTFNLVVFDPPHIIQKDESGWITKQYWYYKDKESAIDSVTKGIDECMRVLKPNGVLIFKWAETSIPTSEILKQINHKPLFGHRSGKKSGTNWMTFMKVEDV